MAECGIKKYDDLPARVGWTDVDSLRYKLRTAMNDVTLIKKVLDEAIKEHEKNEKNSSS